MSSFPAASSSPLVAAQEARAHGTPGGVSSTGESGDVGGKAQR